jgi:hypothetical protein
MNNDSFLSLLAESPFSGLQEHMEVDNKASEALKSFIKSAVESDWKTAKEHRETIVKLEHQADEIKNNIRNHLPKSLFMSVSRQDILDLVFTMDGIPNAAKDISGVMIGRKMVIPEHMSKRFIDCTNSAITATHQACDAIKKVNEMQRSGFGGKNSNQLHHLVAEIEQLEQENDELEISLRNELFKIEQDLPPVDVIFLYDIINKIGILADISQSLGHILIRLVAK